MLLKDSDRSQQHDLDVGLGANFLELQNVSWCKGVLMLTIYLMHFIIIKKTLSVKNTLDTEFCSISYEIRQYFLFVFKKQEAWELLTK